MKKKPELGVKIVAAVQFFTAAMMIAFALACYSLPEGDARRVQQFLEGLPYFRNLPLNYDPWTAFVDLLLGLWGLLKGIGIWRMWSWVRTLILIDLAIWLGDLLMFGALSDRSTLMRSVSNPDFLINLAINLIVLMYFIDPSVKEAFGSERDRV